MKAKEKQNDNELYKSCSKTWNWEALLSYKSLVTLVLSPLFVAILGSASRGDLFLYLVLGWTNWDKLTSNQPTSEIFSENGADINTSSLPNNNETMDVANPPENIVRSNFEQFLHDNKMDDVFTNVAGAVLVSYVVFFGLGGYLQWKYYIKQKSSPETWKCQPNRFLSQKDERHEVLLGSMNLIIGATFSGILATYIINSGDLSKFYYRVSDYGWPYLLASTALTFLYQDAAAYYIHRALHLPFFYKHFHKMHHRYHSPTAFSAVAMHPVEFVTLQMSLAIPMFVIPLHFAAYLSCIFYVYYYGMIDHSGIDMEAIWPWQPPVRFHDDHHKYFHVNFGFNTLLFDRFHDTLRKKSRVYSESIFGGKGLEKKEKSK